MAVAQMRVPTIFLAVDKFSDVVSRMTNKTAHFSKSTVGAINRVDHRLNNMWGSMNNISQLAIGGGVGGLFYYAGKDVMDYETKIASLAAVTGTQIGSMNTQIESLGKRTKMSVIDVAGAFEIVGSKMSQYLDNPDALKSVTDASITMSRAARMQLEPAISSLTGVMNIYRMSAEDAGRVVNKLSAGETVGSVSIAQTADILTQFGAQAVRANVPIEESIALIQTLTKSMGVEGVGRGLRNILFDISSTETWDKNRWKAIRMAGVDFKFVTDNTQDLTARLKELKKLAGTKGAMELFFKRTGTVAANTLFQNFNSEGYTDFLGKIKALNDAESKAAKNTSTLSSMIDKLKATFTNFVVTGNDANGTLGLTKSLIGWITDNMGTLLSLVQRIVLGFLAFKAIVIVLNLVGKAIAIVTAITRAYTFVTTMAALANVSFKVALLDTIKVLGRYAMAQLSAFAMTGAIVGGIAVLAWGLYKLADGFQNMYSKQDYALRNVSLSWKNATFNIASEIEKQKKLIADMTDPSSGGKYDASKLYDLTPNVTAAEEKIAYLSKFKNLPERQQQDALMKWNQDHITAGTKFRLPSNEAPENLAGKTQKDMLQEFIKGKSGKLDINITTPDGYGADVYNTPPSGVEVKTTPNQGSRGQFSWEK